MRDLWQGIRALAALWAGKAAIWCSRRFGRGGSTLPGRIALRIDPDLLARLAAQPREGNLLIAGTNGKTTTAGMLAEVCAAAGYRVVHNRAGANLVPGLAAAFVAAADWWGRLDADLGLLEVDEASTPRAAAETRPRIALVTNFFRDQLDRYGELTQTVDHVRRALAAVRAGGALVLNADDPLAASLAPEEPAALFYGIEAEGVGGSGAGAADARHCLRCGSPFQYERSYYAHLGRYRCPRCGLRRPPPAVKLVAFEPLSGRGSRVVLRTRESEFAVRLSVPGVYNAYNALAAAAAGVALGFSAAQIAAGLQSFRSSFGRMEPIAIGEREVLLALVKNPAGFDAVLRTVLDGPGQKRLLIAINDNYADGTDVSWLWDVDFEHVAAAGADLAAVICSGIRAEDMAVRLKYAGVPEAKLKVENDLRRALELGLAITPPGEALYLLPTYTAMLEARDVMARLGYVAPFWEV